MTGLRIVDLAYIEELEAKASAAQEQATLKGGSGNGTSGGMEARVSKLEALVEGVRADLAKLATVPADVATVKERLSHLPTKIEVRDDIDKAMERAGTRMQRTVGVTGALVAIAVAAINYLPKLLT
jgi:tetrahydromethanopterin S-methyltransferase subunit G